MYSLRNRVEPGQCSVETAGPSASLCFESQEAAQTVPSVPLTEQSRSRRECLQTQSLVLTLALLSRHSNATTAAYKTLPYYLTDTNIMIYEPGNTHSYCHCEFTSLALHITVVLLLQRRHRYCCWCSRLYQYSHLRTVKEPSRTASAVTCQ
jgi:hypothetical protein